MTSVSASCREAEDGGQQANAPSRLTLAKLLQRYGRAVCQDRYRCAGLIRDLCAGSYREQFLWTVALQEGIVAELLEPPPGTLQSLLLAGLSQKLADRLGLSSEAATWAVRSWSNALQDAPEQTEASFAAVIGTAAEIAEGGDHAQAPGWLGWCGGALAASVLALVTVGWCAFHFNVSTIGNWLQETFVLGSGCVLAWWGLRIGSQRILALPRPDWLHLPAAQAVAAALPEILLIVLLPLVPVGVVATWAAACWVSWPHAAGPEQVAWVLARLVQALVLAVFITLWTPPMIETTGRLVAGWRECR